MVYIPIPSDVSNFKIFLNKKSIRNPNFIKEYSSHYALLSKYLKMKYSKWFNLKKKYSSNTIANNIFVWEIDDSIKKEYLKFQTISLMESLERIHQNIHNIYSSTVYKKLDCELIKLKDVIIDSLLLINDCEKYFEEKPDIFDLWKRHTLQSTTIYAASEQLFRRFIEHNHIGSFPIQTTSIFLIRQAIEVKLSNCFGISRIINNNGKIIKVQPILFIDLIKIGGDKINFPIETSLLRKIYDWTNAYIHYGFIPYIWEIEWALHILKPLFTDPASNIHYSLRSPVSIEYSFYDEIEEHIKNIIVKRNSKINKHDIKVIRILEPEVQIIK